LWLEVWICEVERVGDFCFCPTGKNLVSFFSFEEAGENPTLPKGLPEWISKLTLRPMKVDWSSIALHEKGWMKEWDEQVKGSGKRLQTTP